MPYRRAFALAAVLVTLASTVSAGSLFRRLRSTDPPAVQALAAQQQAPVSVPEPSTIVLAVVGLASLVALARSRQI
jgi:PEP-CTERM motif